MPALVWKIPELRFKSKVENIRTKKSKVDWLANVIQPKISLNFTEFATEYHLQSNEYGFIEYMNLQYHQHEICIFFRAKKNFGLGLFLVEIVNKLINKLYGYKFLLWNEKQASQTLKKFNFIDFVCNEENYFIKKGLFWI